MIWPCGHTNNIENNDKYTVDCVTSVGQTTVVECGVCGAIYGRARLEHYLKRKSLALQTRGTDRL